MRLLRSIIVEVVNFIFALLVAVLIFMALRHYILQPFQVEGHSMDDSLADGQMMVMFKQTDIERFDVIVFPDPRGSESSYVKRIIGMPGDTLYYQDDVLYLNGSPLKEPYLEPLKTTHPGLFTSDFSLWDTIGLEVIPEGFYFVMGDNRPYSGDSRQFGLVPIESIQGEANFSYYPLSEFGVLPDYELTPQGTVAVNE